MSAEVTQSTDAPSPDTIADTVYITDTGGTLPLDSHRGRESGTAHLFDDADGSALCGHPSTEEHDRELLCDASHDYNPTHSQRVCKNCSKAIRSRVSAGVLATGTDVDDLLLTTEPGDEIVIEADDVTQTLTVESTGFRHGRIQIEGHTDDHDDSPEHTTDRARVSKRPGEADPDATIAGDLTDERSREDVTVRRPLVADGGVVECTVCDRSFNTLRGMRTHRGVVHTAWLRERIEELYIHERMSAREIGEELDMGRKTVDRWIREFDLAGKQAPIFRLLGYDMNGPHGGYPRWTGTGAGHRVRVHRLLAIAEGADPHKIFSAELTVDHINGCTFDNRPDNLQLLEVGEHGRKDGPKTEHNYTHKEYLGALVSEPPEWAQNLPDEPGRTAE